MERCDRRDLSLEGVPMLLGLETLGTPPSSVQTSTPDPYGNALADAATELFAQLLEERPEPTVRELRLFVEALTQGFFTPSLEPAPAGLELPPPPPYDEPPLLLPKPFAASWAEWLANLRNGSYLRVVNFHNTPRRYEAEYEAQIRLYAEHFAPVTEEDLEQLFRTGRWHKEKPPVLLCFFEGTRNHYDVILPLLEKYGLTGWFFVIPGFLDVPPAEQPAFAEAHDLGLVPDEYGGERFTLSWDEVRDLAREHVVTSHTLTHTALTPDSPEEVMVREILESGRVLETQLGCPIHSFAWLRAGEHGLNGRADELLLASGYRFLFSTFKLQKLRD